MFGKKQDGQPIPGCSEYRWCFGEGYPHRPCHICNATTCNKRMVPHPETLQRKLLPTCEECSVGPELAERRALRAKQDWTRPIPDQFPSTSRTTIHTFHENPEPDLVLRRRGMAGILNASLRTLGLHREMYAEERSHKTVLRRVST